MTEHRILKSLHVSEEEVEAIQLARLKAFIPVVAERHPFFRERLSTIDVSGWSKLSDVDAIPLTTKADLAGDPDAFRLRTDTGDYHESWDLVYTSGTTGRPVPIHQSTHDYRRILFAQRRMADIRGILSSDTIANLFPLAVRPNGSWLRVNDHALAVGATLVAGLGGPETGEFSATRRIAEVVHIVAEANPTILWGVGSYLRRFLAMCEKEDRRLPTVRMVVASGEALEPAINSSIRRSLQSLGATSVVVSPGFGASELQCSLVACEEGSGLHNPAPELFLLQTVDEDAKTLPSGAPGRLVLTHLDRTGTVLIRYALGDVVILDRSRCPACGRAGERIVAHHGRGDTMVKIRGQLVDLRAVALLVAADPDVTEHAIHLVPADHQNPEGMDMLQVRIALSIGADPAEIAGRVEQAVSSAISVRPIVVPTGAEEIFPIDEVMKPARVRRTR